MEHTTTSTIDGAGRIVIPKAIREAAGLRAGTRLRLRWRDGRIEVEPEPRRVTVEVRGRLVVAVPAEPGPTLSETTVEETRERLRTRIEA
jgi:AbrB family looped-hinge helix DNA binding protein